MSVQSIPPLAAPPVVETPVAAPLTVPVRALRRDALYWLGCAMFAMLLALFTTLTPHRVWGACASVGYATAAVLARRSPRDWGSRTAPVAALVGAVALPLLILIGVGAAQSEVHVVEHAGSLLLNSGSPYVPHPTDVDDYNPYLPGMALFGVPHALLGDTALADARVWFGAAFLASMRGASRGLAARGLGSRGLAARGLASRGLGSMGLASRGLASRGLASTSLASKGPALMGLAECGRGAGGASRTFASVPLLAAFPAVALPLAVGGVDLPVIGLMCLSLALAGRGGKGMAAGLAMGAAAALKWTAWPLLPVGLVLLALTSGRRAAVRAAVTALLLASAAVVPAALADPHAFLEHVVLFPLGEGGTQSPATSTLPGYLLATYVPGGSFLALAALAAAAVAVAVSLRVRPPRTVVAAADRLALGLGLAMCLIPATRFGYLVYPLILATWFRRPAAQGAQGAPGAQGGARP
ncbi:glycosyltransferase 87 family protein [Streptomyces sp. NPDC002888]|uniref:glycosyltransferase 87 family protein n=1 Tax=Streptomyces sp. NPDC002888 TaxID=3364668 RepID=UPI00368CFDBF